MNRIKGLIIKDLLQLKSYMKTLVIFLIIFFIISMSNEAEESVGTMLILMMTLGFGMFAIASFNYDEIAKADKYILTLPVTKKEIVLSKYILIVGGTVIGSLTGVILSIIITYIIKSNIPNIFELLTMALGGVLGVSIIQSIQIPLIYKYGAEKGRIHMFIVVIVVAFSLGGIIYLIEESLGNLINFDALNNIISNFAIITFIVITSIIYYISYRVSLKIYNKKEI